MSFTLADSGADDCRSLMYELTVEFETAWDEAWKHGLTPWDQSDVQPALTELVEQRWSELDPPVDWASLSAEGGRALVAGCGRVSFLVSRSFPLGRRGKAEHIVYSTRETTASTLALGASLAWDKISAPRPSLSRARTSLPPPTRLPM